MDAVTLALIKSMAGGGGSSLPPVTSSDNGKVLAVEDGAWAAESNLFIVTKNGGANTADKTLDEVKAAAAAGKTVILKYASSGYVDVAVYAGEYYGVVYFATVSSDTTHDYLFYMSGGNSLTQVRWPKLPRPSESDNGSELIVKNGNWAKQKKKFVVTLTPTSPDYSGTMDKTVAEINAAYEAGQEIVFRFVVDQNTHADVAVTAVNDDIRDEYPSFDAFAIILSANVLVYAHTNYTDDGTKQTYSTTVYSLTPGIVRR